MANTGSAGKGVFLPTITADAAVLSVEVYDGVLIVGILFVGGKKKSSWLGLLTL